MMHLNKNAPQFNAMIRSSIIFNYFQFNLVKKIVNMIPKIKIFLIGYCTKVKASAKLIITQSHVFSFFFFFLANKFNEGCFFFILINYVLKNKTMHIGQIYIAHNFPLTTLQSLCIRLHIEH